MQVFNRCFAIKIFPPNTEESQTSNPNGDCEGFQSGAPRFLESVVWRISVFFRLN
ncbi:rCG59171, isoform CRA_a [Rattus norvegicus]|uniref:RCG59171, isoform CRA_a n=1 Tax=Rattus norvegicus TaxID=10116 RepID=A6KIV9_RAT|nr:rCG59171, isoform CRA_a [Rattus norvegicus]EDL87150.1 rCG59171, isoform CRA_a [Rattus norvegicus]EDL87151.1 rCG59171, isoform CRA_a [Rattus norvegicus]EDL87152.1 rCG59171, isoform CRA_a [Rattus norvegicus]EDL87153.1 rCG59171, isoform CRA_a [Rattus norvegicus]